MRRLLLGFVLTLAAVGAGSAAQMAPLPKPGPGQAVATFAGGCFWCTEIRFRPRAGRDLDHLGLHRRPRRQSDLRAGLGRRHRARRVGARWSTTRARSSYQQLLTYYWHHVDPTVKDRQFCDHGHQYRTAIFVHNDEERKLAEASKKKVEAELKKPIYTEIVDAGPFYPAEEYHQDFYLKNPAKYKFYRWNCGRDQRLEQLWGKREGRQLI